MKKLLKLCLVVLVALTVFGCAKEEPVVELTPVQQLVESATETFYEEANEAVAEATKVEVKSEEYITELTAPVTITVWNTYTAHQQEAFQALVDGFNASQDKVTVVYEPQAYADYDTNLLNAVRNGTGPNVTNRYCSSAAAYVNEDLLVNLGDYVKDPTIGIPNFKDNLVGKEYEEVTQWGQDSVYVFPVIITSEVLYVNKTLFDKYNQPIPSTWEELATASKAIYEGEGIPGWGSDSETDTMIDRVIQLGSKYLNAETCEVEVDETAFKTALEWYLQGLDEGYFRLAGADMYHSGPFTNGLVASYIGSSAGAGYVLPYVDFDCQVTVIPQTGDETFAPAWGGGLVAFKSTPEENLASYLFLKYCLEDEVLAKGAIEFGAMPATYTALETATYQNFAAEDKVAQALIKTAPCINWVNSIPGADGVRNAFGFAVDNSAAELAE